MVYLVNLVANVFVDVAAALVDTGNSGLVAMVNIPVVLVPDTTRAAIISSA